MIQPGCCEQDGRPILGDIGQPLRGPANAFMEDPSGRRVVIPEKPPVRLLPVDPETGEVLLAIVNSDSFTY